MNVTDESTFLFATPSFLTGMARVVDMGQTLEQYNVSGGDALADFRAITADWQAVGNDLRQAIREFAEAHPAR